MQQIDIALGLYNGKEYLNEFLNSLEEQTFRNWRLVVRDDGSVDNSLDIVIRWARENNRPLKVVHDLLGNLQVIGNFSTCLQHTDAPYVMLADQDDVWFPHKVEDAFEAILRLESECPVGTPIAVYCDLQVVDASLHEIHPSMLEMQQQGRRRLPSMPQLLAQNVAPGCSMIVNRALLDVGLPIPPQAAMHDWWLVLLAQALGKVGHINRPGIAYRQHGNNQVGAKRGGIVSMFHAFLRGGVTTYRSRFERSKCQAFALARRIPLDHPHQEVLRLYAGLHTLPPLIRQVRAYQAGISKVGKFRNLVFFLLM